MNKLYELNQGTIIYGIKSSKYHGNVCYGILITASCDIAHSKVSKYYYLLGVNVKEWINSEYGFQYIFGRDISRKKEEIRKKIARRELDADVLLTFSGDELDEVISNNPKIQKHNDEIRSLLGELEAANQSSSINDAQMLSIKVEDKIKNKLTEIIRGKEAHLYYLPQKSYLYTDITNNGLIIDLQEIGYIYPEEANSIVANRGIDQTTLSKLQEPTATLLRNDFCFDATDSFIDIEGIIASPWREHLLQRFSYGFIRIGLEDFPDCMINSMLSKIIGG